MQTDISIRGARLDTDSHIAPGQDKGQLGFAAIVYLDGGSFMTHAFKLPLLR